jgi:hypothetical protein
VAVAAVATGAAAMATEAETGKAAETGPAT